MSHTVETESRWLLRRLAEEFPGLVTIDDEYGGPDVSGGDLVDFLTYQIAELDLVRADMREAIASCEE